MRGEQEKIGNTNIKTAPGLGGMERGGVVVGTGVKLN